VMPSQSTQFKILYDAKFLYVGIRAFDSDPDQIVKRMSRRDGFEGDFVEINIDSYADKRTAFSFSASVSGVKGDEYITNNGDNWDSTWDPIWYLKTSVDDQGWIAEFKIPLSQLRFADKENHTWGLQIMRRLFRNEERSTWQPINPTAPGWVHLFGELNGIKGIKPQKQLEILPYVVGQTETYPVEEENPFRNTGKEQNTNIGVDAKIGITSDITLDLTVNPDFGQVEADPSRVNLSAFRLFFREQRAFFLEGANTLTFPTSGGINNLFYSRRIGGSPKGSPDGENIAYMDKPSQTRILGAAKLTGKNAKGFSWGILESFTDRAFATVIDTVGARRKEKVEPYTNYFVARAQQDIDGGKTVFGGFFSSVHRMGNDENGLELLHDNAHSGGFDLDHNFKNRNYGFILRGMYSQVNGSQGAIYRTQTASERFFQRPNNRHTTLDSTRTSLTGTVGTFAIGKRSGNFTWTVGSNYRSPSLALNDIGFLVQTDNINNWFFTRYRVIAPNRFFRSQNYRLYGEQNIDFGGVQTSSSSQISGSVELLNLWQLGQEIGFSGQRISNADLRGGPSIIYPGGTNYGYWIGTNPQNKLRMSFNNSYNWRNQNFAKSSNYSFNIRYRPIDAMSLSLSPEISKDRNNLQYINQFSSESGTQYLLGRVIQETYSMSMRMNYNITPNLTLEFWGQPFIAKAEFDQFKWVDNSTSDTYSARFIDIAQSQITLSESKTTYTFDGQFELDDPDFNLVEFRSNLVARWEYIPGSTLFLVWANNGSYSDLEEDNNFNTLTNKLTDLKGTNTFLLKYSYRFVL
ncbi:MAG: DUF5916 domain-containing protein, partial [Cyclobacteriaceae bacterium]